MRIVCKKEKCNRYELPTEECLEIHKKIFHGNQQFKDGHRPIEYCCSKRNEGLKCNTLIDTIIQGEPKYRDKKGKEYKNIESVQIRTKLWEIEIEENQRKRKGDTLSPREEERMIKVRVTSRKKEKVKNAKSRTSRIKRR